ncbi:threonine/serine ThrE exporter family protein [Nocardioides solisilvae]|uniref:threonine/serine ThrE exporter family protein n=1 Tax=Nocardioides solisilvae TaxID=1542435 RepID=UPI001EF65AB4|nr:threonine/serine exporter family protein [Nocardioides solisilvae]
MDVKELNLTLDLCLRIGEMLLANGAGAADVTATMGAVAHHLGLRNTDIDVTFTQVSMGYQYDAAMPTLLMIRQIKQRDIDYEDLTQVDHLVRDLLRGELDLYLARNRMATIVSVGHHRKRWAVTAGTGVMCAAVALFLGGGPLVVAIAFVAAATIDRVQLFLARWRLPTFYLQVAGGTVATLFAVGAAATGMDVDPSLVVTANIIMLLAGIGFMGALQDALSGFYVTAGARIIEALLATAGIIAGVSGGLTVGGMLGVDVGQLEPGASGWQDIGVLSFGAALCAAAFAYSAYSPKRILLPIAVVAGTAAAIFRIVDETDAGRPWAAATAAFFIGLVSYAVSGRVKVPPLVVVVSAIVPLLPGLSIYRGLSLLGEGGAAVSQGLLAMVTAASVAIALASGVILGEYVAQPVKREARRLEQRLAGPRLVGVFRARQKR